jgi:hypothetical protein
MPQDSVQQAIARGAIVRLQRTPQLLSRTESGVILALLNELTKAIQNAPEIPNGGDPDRQLNLGEVQTRELIALLQEFVRIPTGP